MRHAILGRAWPFKVRTLASISAVANFFGAVALLSAQTEPLIRVSSRLVEVDVTVRDHKGPVRGLTQDDFAIFDKGKQQPISLFNVTDLGNRDALGSVSNSAPALPPGVVSNRAARDTDTPGSATVILVDRLNTPLAVQPYADRELLRFIQSAKKGDRIAIYVMGSQIRVVHDFTTEPSRLIEAASRIKIDRSADLNSFEMIRELAAAGAATAPLQEMSNLAKIDRATGTSQALSLIAQHLAAVPGRKKLIWISSSFPLVIREGGFRRDFVPEIQKATRMLNDANVVVYPVDARGLMNAQLTTPVMIPSAPGAPPNNFSQAAPGSNPNEGIDTMNTVASWTGGQAYYNTNDLKGAIRQAINDAEVTYTLGYYVASESLDGSFHDLKVKISKSGEVRYRKGYLASPGPMPTEKQRTDSIRQLFSTPLDSQAVGLTAHAEPEAAKSGAYRVTVAVDVRDLRIRPEGDSWVGSVSFGFGLESANPPAFTMIAVPIRLNEQQLREAMQNGLLLQQTVVTGASRDRLRVAVQDAASGALGSLWMPLGID